MARIQRGLDELSCSSHRPDRNCQKSGETSRVEWVYAILSIMTDEAKKKTPDAFTDDAERFSSFFHRVLSLSLDDSLASKVRTQLLTFFINAFQSLDNGLIRKECAPLVSISIWHYLHDESAREHRFERHLQLKKAWRASTKRYEAADDAAQSKLRFERAWLYSMILDFISRLYGSESGSGGSKQHLPLSGGLLTGL